LVTETTKQEKKNTMSFSIVYKLKSDKSVDSMIKIKQFCDYLGYSMNDFTVSERLVRTENGRRDNYFYICKKMYVKFLNELGYSSRIITEMFGISRNFSEKCCYNTYKKLFQKKNAGYENMNYAFVQKKIDFFISEKNSNFEL
jgi:hypothetical protein